MSSPAPFNDARTRILAANLGAPIAWPNEPFRKPTPTDGSGNAQLWVSVSSTSNMLMPVEMSGGVWQEDGTLYIDVMAPVGSGTDAARTLAKAAANVFRGISAAPNSSTTVSYLGGSIGNGQVADPDGMWWCLTVSVDWRYQDTT